MNMERSGDVTGMLAAWRRGDAQAAEAVFTLVYDDLRRVARRQLARLEAGRTLAPTVLVHEAYLKFAERSAPHVVDRAHFLAVASRAMRHVVVDYLRRRRALKRDGGVRVPLEASEGAHGRPAALELLAIHEALARLEVLDERQARIADMRLFGGLELGEIAEALGVSERTVKRDWHKARVFLAASVRL